MTAPGCVICTLTGRPATVDTPVCSHATRFPWPRSRVLLATAPHRRGQAALNVFDECPFLVVPSLGENGRQENPSFRWKSSRNTFATNCCSSGSKTPASAPCCTRVFRDETTAISDMAKRPFTRIRSRRNRNSMGTASKEGVGMNYTRRRTRILLVRERIDQEGKGGGDPGKGEVFPRPGGGPPGDLRRESHLLQSGLRRQLLPDPCVEPSV